MRSIVCALVLGGAPVALHAQAARDGGGAQVGNQEAQDKTDSTFTFDGEAALWTVAIRPDKTADFDRVLGKLRQALTMSEKPEVRKQAEGWTVLRLSMPLPDGNIAYVHDVRPVVSGADYSVMRILYAAFPDESRELYELYRGAFVKNLSLATGSVVMDAKSAQPGDTVTTPAALPSAAPPEAAPQTPPPAR